MQTLAVTDTELNQDCESNSSFSEENDSCSQSESEISRTSNLDEDTSDSDFQPDNEGNLEDPDDESDGLQGRDNTEEAAKQEHRKQLQRDPIHGDSWHQHANKIRRLIRQAESSGKCSYLGPAVGWDEERLNEFFRSIDEEIPDVANITGKQSNSFL